MHKALLALPIAMLLSTQAFAVECSTSQSSEIIVFQGWETRLNDDGQTLLVLTVQSHAELGIRLIDGSVQLADVLGERIGSYRLERDAQIGPGQAFTLEQTINGRTPERLLTMHADDVVGIACVSGLVFEDGTVTHFAQR